MAYTIPLSGNLDIIGTEKLIKKYYQKTCGRAVDEIVFDASEVTFISTWTCSLFLIWMGTCKRLQEKTVKFIHPKDPDSRSYLIRWRFQSILEQLGVEIDGPKHEYYITPTEKGFYDDVLPFIFFQEIGQFEKYYSDLMIENFYYNTFTAILGEKFVKEGDLRNIFLRELGYNFCHHAKAHLAHIAMVKVPGISRKKFDKRLQAVPKWMIPFYRKVGTRDVVEIILSDGGAGLINPKLKSVFKTEYNRQPDEEELIDYAFQYHTTSRTKEERIGKLLQKADKFREKPDDLIEHSIATGLYYVRELAKDLKAFLIVRTGQSLCFFDFLNSSKGQIRHCCEPSLADKRLNRRSDLGKFPGLQYRILVPLGQVQKRSNVDSSYTYLTPKQPENMHSKLIRAADFITSPAVMEHDEPQALEGIWNLERELISETRLNSFSSKSGHESVVLLDLAELSLSERMWQILFSTLICLPHEGRSAPFFPVNVEYTGQMHVALNSIVMLKTESYLRKTYPVILFNGDFQAKVVGSNSPQEERLLRAVLESNEDHINEILAEGFSLRQSSIFPYIRISESEKLLSAMITAQEIRFLWNEVLKTKLSEFIKNPDNGIKHEGEYYLLPGKYYTRKYFELLRLFEQPYSMNLLSQILAEEIFKSFADLDLVITFGKHLGQIVDTAIKRVGTMLKPPDTEPDHLVIKSAYEIAKPNMEEVIKTFDIPKGSRALIITDLISSGRTLKQHINWYCQKFEVEEILTIVDARSSGPRNEFLFVNSLTDKEVKISLYAVLRDKIKRYTKYPVGPESKIRRVDPRTGLLVAKSSLEAPISILDFFKKELNPTRAVFCGHFGSEETHYTYFLKMLSLLNGYGKMYAGEIRNKVQEQIKAWHYYDQKEREKKIIIAYPEDSPGINILIEEIVRLEPKWFSLPVNRKKLEEVPSVLRNLVSQSAFYLLLDTATSTGTTLAGILDTISTYVSKFEDPSHFIVCSIVSRLPQEVSSKFFQIAQYAGQYLKIHFLRHLEIPGYNSTNCPVCQKGREVKKTLKFIKMKESLHKFLLPVLDNFDIVPREYISDTGLHIETAASTSSLRQAQYRVCATIATTYPGKDSIEYRKMFRTIAEKYIEHRNDSARAAFIDLLSMIDTERFGLFNEERVFKDVFYHDVSDAIIKASKKLISELTQHDDFSKLIWPISKFIPEEFWGHFDKFVKIYKNDNNILRYLILETILAVSESDFPISEAQLRAIIDFLHDRSEAKSYKHKVFSELHDWAKSRYRYTDTEKAANSFMKLRQNIIESSNWKNYLTADRPKWDDPHDNVWQHWLEETESLDIMDDYKRIYESPLGTALSSGTATYLLSPEALRWMIKNMDDHVKSLRNEPENSNEIIEVLNSGWKNLRKFRDKLEKEMLYYCTCSLAEQMKVVKDNISSRPSMKNIVIDWEQPAFRTDVIGASNYVRLILICLLENLARAYPPDTNKEGRAEIEIKRNHSEVILKVCDWGQQFSGEFGVGLSAAKKNCERCYATLDLPNQSVRQGSKKCFSIFFKSAVITR